MGEEKLLKRFPEIVQRGKLFFIPAASATRVLQYLFNCKIRLLGIDGFILNKNSVTPLTQWIADYSSNQPALSIALDFVNQAQKEATHFEFILGDKICYDDVCSKFIKQLLAVVPELEPNYQVHLKDNDELLPHVFMGDLTRFALMLHKKAKGKGKRATDARMVLTKILTLLEQGITSGGAEIEELIVVSFLENLYHAGDDFETFTRLLGPHLKRELLRMNEPPKVN